MNNQARFSPKVIASIFILFLTGFFLVGLFSLQVISGGENYQRAVENTHSSTVEVAPRGKILDVNGEVLATNYIKREIRINTRGVSSDDLRKIDEVIYDFSGKKLTEFPKGDGDFEYVLSQIEEDEYSLLKNELEEFSYMVTFLELTEREYSKVGKFSHVLGYVSKASDEDIDSGIDKYSLVGKFGIEKYYDSYLQGENGVEVVFSRLDGSREKTKLNNTIDGADVVLTIDAKWQEKLFDILTDNAKTNGSFGASGIIMDSESGEIKAMVNYPTFDNNIFNRDLNSDEYSRLVEDESSPILNRSIGMRLSPGSTFKPLVAVAALDDGLVQPGDYYNSVGCEKISKDIDFCEADGKILGGVNMYTAIARSSNLYFCDIGRKFNDKYGEQAGVQYLADFVDRVDFAERSGIDLDGEVASVMASPEKVTKAGGRLWSIGDMCNTVIGQGQVGATPIKMLTIAASYVNNGEVLQPYLVKEIKDSSGGDLYSGRKKVVSDLGVDVGSLDVINEGMRLSVLDSQGSGRSLVSLDNNVRIKTGSADASERLSGGRVVDGAHSWIIGSFDFEGRQYSFVVVQQFGGRGYKTVPIIGSFVSCLNKGFVDGCEVF